MEKLKTVLTARIEQPYLDMLKEFCDIKVTGWAATDSIWTEEEIFPELEDAEILIIGYEKITEEMLEKLPKVKLIACCRSNPVNIDVKAATQRAIPVVFTPGRNANAVAEFTVGLMLDICRKLAFVYNELKNGRYLGETMDKCTAPQDSADIIWELPDVNVYAIFKGFELAGKTLGLIGYGLIGSLVAKKAAAFGLNVVVYDPYFKGNAQQEGIKLTSLDELLKCSDFVSLHCKETPETRGIIGERELSLMKKSAYIINTARAAMIDEQAIIKALEQETIAGAALDVFWNEPLPCDHPILKMKNVLITPHIAGSSKDVPVFQSKMVAEDVITWIKGGNPIRVCRP